jgi:rhodanese-related sulfurtransferase/predicted metal-dependent enzyme (double-stranded beta helix superfamily)
MFPSLARDCRLPASREERIMNARQDIAAGIAGRRAQAVRGTIEAVRAIEAQHGVTREALDRIKSELVKLASQTELFPAGSFGNLPGRPGTIFHLAEDPDGRFALYGSAGAPGKAQPPHNHTTWACIAGVYGDEHNVFYDRVEDRPAEAEARLVKTGELTVVKGNACAFLPDDFHTIEVVNGKESLHLHLYGKTLEDLPGRVYFGSSAGGKYQRFMSRPEIFAPRVSPAELKAMIADGGELAILDPREEGVYARNHLFLAASCPLSRMELMVGALVPRAGTRIVLVDEDEKVAQRAAAVLRRFGYRQVSVLAGGLAGWTAAGYELYSGVFVPSKAFGEYVEHRDGTPRISAGELKAKLDAGEDVVVVDSRPMGEYQVMNIPGAVDCPGAELVYRVPGLAKKPETLVVVNCAGRTRSIIGAQSLINAKLPNKVVALKNGTMGWHLAGFELEKGSRQHAPEPGSEALAHARALADGVARRFGIARLDRAGLARFAADGQRTTYLFDVRTPEEYAQGHLPGAVSAPGGQLVQATDTYMATRNARVALVDSEGVRAVMTASWLLQMGWPEVVVVEDTPRVDEVTAVALKALAEVQVLDFGTSLEYRAGHVPGAAFAIRSRLAERADKFARAGVIVCTSTDGVLARFAAADLARIATVPVMALAGGTRAWRDAGFALETGETQMWEPNEDVYYKPYDRKSQVEQAMQDYLDWEVALVEKIARDSDVPFVDFPEAT